MDRFSIIQQQVFNKTIVDEISSCDLDQCACDETAKNEKSLLKKTDLFQVALITIAAFIGALTMKANMANENMMPSTKRTSVISCSSKSDRSDDKLPGDRNNRNTCSHQQSFLSESNNSKRKILKIHTC